MLFILCSPPFIPVVGGGALGVFPIAMSVVVAHLFLLPFVGCSINPSLSFGPSLVAAMAGMDGTNYR
jgi:glycerol uptake facilitator-like aquaporin